MIGQSIIGLRLNGRSTTDSYRAYVSRCLSSHEAVVRNERIMTWVALTRLPLSCSLPLVKGACTAAGSYDKMHLRASSWLAHRPSQMRSVSDWQRLAAIAWEGSLALIRILSQIMRIYRIVKIVHHAKRYANVASDPREKKELSRNRRVIRENNLGPHVLFHRNSTGSLGLYRHRRRIFHSSNALLCNSVVRSQSRASHASYVQI